MEDNKSDKKNSNLREENKKKRRILEKEFDITNWFESDNNELPPEIESFFLDNIKLYEKGIRCAKRITVYELIKSPSYRKIIELSDLEIEVELNSIRALLLEHQIVLDTLREVPKEELYRFITEELFSEEINDVVIPDMVTHFIYEEFHPNHDFDLRQLLFDFLSSYLDQSSDFYKYSLSGEAAQQDWHIHFRNAFSTFAFDDFTIADLKYDLEIKEAHVHFACEIMAMPEGSHEHVYFKGKGKLHFVYENDFWGVNVVELPAPQI